MTATPPEPDPMGSSILNDIKKTLNLVEAYDAFDQDILLYINAVLSNAAQVGIGPDNGFMIIGKGETWRQLLGDDKLLNNVKLYISLKVKMLFDPPQTAHAIAATERIIAEQEYRMSVHRENQHWVSPVDVVREDAFGEVVIDGGLI